MMYTIARIIDERIAAFTCSRCGQVVSVDARDAINQPDRNFSLACTCGHLNESVLESRTSARKKVNISGIYKVSSGSRKEKTGSLTVKNISWQGFKLEVSTYEHGIKEHDLYCSMYTREGHDSQSIFVHNSLKVGDQITIEFFLDDPKMSFISRPVIIKWMRSDYAGVELSYPKAFDPSIRFYLLGLKNSG